MSKSLLTATIITISIFLAIPALAAPEPTANLLWFNSTASKQAQIDAYRHARFALEQALNDPNWAAAIEQTGKVDKLPPAVILDVDETVLNNSFFQLTQTADSKAFDPAAFSAWCEQSLASPISGALDFVHYARSRGVAIYYVTNRSLRDHDCTERNLQYLGFPVSADAVLTVDPSRGWTSDKTSRRQYLATRYRILLLVGDNLSDFVAFDSFGKTLEEQVRLREEFVKHYNDRFCSGRFTYIRNPIYGPFENVRSAPTLCTTSAKESPASSPSMPRTTIP